jgi:hypothetical protein
MYLYARKSIDSHGRKENAGDDRPAASVFGSILSSSLPAREKTEARIA